MKKILIGLLVLGVTLFAEVSTVSVTPTVIENNTMKIIDVRTEGEWIQTGVIKDAYLITFFNEQYGYDVEEFLTALNKVVKKDEKFAIICNSGSRTKLISNFLGNKLGYNVINFDGGMVKLFAEGFQPEFYAPPAKK